MIVFREHSNSTQLLCLTSPAPSAMSLPVVVMFEEAIRRLNHVFEYMVNPSIYNIEPLRSFQV